MIQLKDIFNIHYYQYGQCFTGSEKGMRYRIAREPLVHAFWGDPELRKIEPKLKVSIWPEPYSYENTKEELKTDIYFAYTKEGLEEACAWLNQVHKEKYIEK